MSLCSWRANGPDAQPSQLVNTRQLSPRLSDSGSNVMRSTKVKTQKTHTHTPNNNMFNVNPTPESRRWGSWNAPFLLTRFSFMLSCGLLGGFANNTTEVCLLRTYHTLVADDTKDNIPENKAACAGPVLLLPKHRLFDQREGDAAFGDRTVEIFRGHPAQPVFVCILNEQCATWNLVLNKPR